MAELHKVLVANRGEIALRIIRAARDCGLATVAVYAPADSDAPHVRLADEAHPLGGGTAAESYLAADALIEVALHTGADAVHPGYGFLSEDVGFAQAVIEAGLTWVGPPPEAIRALGDKVSARAIARAVGAPLTPGTAGTVYGPAEIVSFAEQHGLPVAIKAVFGGGGRGMRVARTLQEIPELFEAAGREAEAAFGHPDCFVERYLDQARHVEAQVIADRHGTVVVVGTRDCSVQRRNQKLVEEAPAPFLPEPQRRLVYTSAKAICRHVGYVGAGTVEYLLGRDGTLSFLEVNPRLQVEHPVTEETSGIDLVRETFRIAAGEALCVSTDPKPRGHSIEFRINAEDPDRAFLPRQGTVRELRLPAGPGIRIDAGVEPGSEVGVAFDSLLLKVIVTGMDRTNALQRSRRALDELSVLGVPTVIGFHRELVRDPAFAASRAEDFTVHTRWIETRPREATAAGLRDPAVAEATTEVRVIVGGRALVVDLPGLAALGDGLVDAVRAQSKDIAAAGTVGGVDDVVAPMQGSITKVAVRDGQHVEAGDALFVLEAMKMEHLIVAHKEGTIRAMGVAVGDTASQDEVLCRVCA